MPATKTFISDINSQLSRLNNHPGLEAGLEVANKIIELLGLEAIPVERIKETIVGLPSSDRYNAWFERHPIFADGLACFALSTNDLIETKFYHLKKHSRQIAAGSVGFELNFEDEDFTRKGDFKVGLDFFLLPDGKSVQIALSNRGHLRLVELNGRLTQTQVEIFDQWLGGATACADKSELHNRLWDSFGLKSVNQKFYDGIAQAFNELLEHLTGIGRDEEQAKLFSSRLLGRLLFCWFLRKKKIINEDMGYFSDVSKLSADEYYHSRLEPLFFATLNTSLDKRSWKTKTATALLPTIDKDTPYLNGGLFEEHEDDWYQDADLTFPADFFSNLYSHFEEFNFTTDESSLEYEQVAIDPEMLGRIFESFLAEQIDESTGQQARKAKGAFYTPREIVSYMCKESVRSYLLNCYPENNRYAIAVNNLLDTSDRQWGAGGSNSKHDNVPREYVSLVLDALRDFRILDPACGSGAFPMGILQLCLRNYERLENNFDSYGAKLKIIQNNIFGSDIEPMAIEIARLRVWLSLVVDTKDNNDIRPLPNLDFNFVCADSLMSLQAEDLVSSHTQLYERLQKIMKQYFKTHSLENKKNLQRDYDKLTKFQQLGLGGRRTEQLRDFNPFKNDSPADFFDTDYMFGIKEFDVVIANPPYIQLQKNGGKLAKKYKNEGFRSFTPTGDIYQLFFEQGINMLKQSGTLCFITSNKWMRTAYGQKLRQLFADQTQVIQLIDLGPGVFEATVDTNILILNKSIDESPKSKACKIESAEFNPKVIKDANVAFDIPAVGAPWLILNEIERGIKEKIEKVGTPLKEWDINIYRGILTGYNDAFIVDNETKDRLVAEDPKSAEILKPILRGKDIKRYRADWAGKWLIDSHNGYGDIPPIDINDYSAIKNHLDQYWSHISSRGDKGNTPYNLRNCAYHEEFNRANIVWQRITQRPTFCFSKPGQHILDSMAFISAKQATSQFILPILNSSVIEYWIHHNVHKYGQTGYRLSNQYVALLPIPKIEDRDIKMVEELIMLTNTSANMTSNEDLVTLQRNVDKMVCAMFGLDEAEVSAVRRLIRAIN